MPRRKISGLRSRHRGTKPSAVMRRTKVLPYMWALESLQIAVRPYSELEVKTNHAVSAPQPPRKPKKKKAPKAAPAGMAGRSNYRPAAKQLPGAAKPSAPAALGNMPTSTPVSAPKPSLGGAATGAARAAPAVPGAARAPPPPPAPPAAPARPAKEMYKALYNFTGQEGEMNLVKGEEVEVKEKDDNGELPKLRNVVQELTFRMVDDRQEWSRRLGSIELVSLGA